MTKTLNICFENSNIVSDFEFSAEGETSPLRGGRASDFILPFVTEILKELHAGNGKGRFFYHPSPF
jgi:hypothetical protein